MPDRTTKILLVIIAVGLWGTLLRPLFTPLAVRAQQPAPPTPSLAGSHIALPPALVVDKNWIYVAADGYLTQFQRDGDGELVAQDGRSFRYPGKLAVSK